MLADVWGLGHCLIGALTFESAAYVARYCLKKVTGDPAAAHYAGRLPEFALMSRRPGIGGSWFDVYSSDVYPSDEFVARGHASKPPRYFDERLRLTDPSLYEIVKHHREMRAKPRESDLRLATRERVCQARFAAGKQVKESRYV